MTKTQFVLLILGFYFISVSGQPEDLYFATGTEIKRWDLSQSSTSTAISGLDRAVSLDFDVTDGKLFWGDVYSDGIYRADLSSSGTASGKTKIASASTPDGLAVDWVLKHVYWTDKGSRTVRVSNYDGTGLKTLIDTDLSAPRAIALSQEDGYMFLTDWGNRPKIERTSMDGSFRTDIATANLYWPNGLTIDRSAKRIYWIDGSLSRIDSANFDGSDVQNIISPGHSYLNHPFSLALVGITLVACVIATSNSSYGLVGYSNYTRHLSDLTSISATYGTDIAGYLDVFSRMGTNPLKAEYSCLYGGVLRSAVYATFELDRHFVRVKLTRECFARTYIYFTDWGSLYSDSYFKRMKTSGLYKTELYSQSGKVFDVKLYDPSTQVRDTALEALAAQCQSCSSNQICLPRPHDDNCVSVTCACPDSHVSCSTSYHTTCGVDNFVPPTTTPPIPPTPDVSEEFDNGNDTDKDDDEIQSSVLIGLMVACALCGVLLTLLVGVCIRQKVCKKNAVSKLNTSQRQPAIDQPPPYVAVINYPQHHPGVNQQSDNGVVNGRDSFNFNNYANKKNGPLSVTDY